MVKIKGVYKNGAIKLEEKINATVELDVIVEFLPKINTLKKAININDLNWLKSQKTLESCKGNWSADVIEERREGN